MQDDKDLYNESLLIMKRHMVEFLQHLHPISLFASNLVILDFFFFQSVKRNKGNLTDHDE